MPDRAPDLAVPAVPPGPVVSPGLAAGAAVGTPPGAAAGSWAAVLDEMEHRVVLAERYLSGEDLRLRHFALPGDLGPLPPDLVGRAGAVLAATRAVESRLATELSQLAQRVSAATRMAPDEGRPPPLYLDRSA